MADQDLIAAVGIFNGNLCPNKKSDVRLVRERLNVHAKRINLAQPLDVNLEQFDERTLQAIRDFQRIVMSKSPPLGRISPTKQGGTTLAKLLAEPPSETVLIVFQCHTRKPTGVHGLPGAERKEISKRYESNVFVSGAVSGRFRGSIYPDNMKKKGRIKNGTNYEVYLGFHIPQKAKQKIPEKGHLKVATNGLRAVLIVNANGRVPVVSLRKEKTSSGHIHIHNGYFSWKADVPMSDGCLILMPNHWSSFIGSFIKAYPNFHDWVSLDGRVGKKIGKLIVE